MLLFGISLALGVYFYVQLRILHYKKRPQQSLLSEEDWERWKQLKRSNGRIWLLFFWLFVFYVILTPFLIPGLSTALQNLISNGLTPFLFISGLIGCIIATSQNRSKIKKINTQD